MTAFYPLQIIKFTDYPDRTGYSEYLPDPALEEYIMCYWFFRRSIMTGDILVNPDCCADIIFNLDASSEKDFSIITGTFGEKFEASATGINVCGVRLKPGIMHHILRDSMESLSSQTAGLSDLGFTDNAYISENIRTKTNREIVTFFNEYLPHYFLSMRSNNPKFRYCSHLFEALSEGKEMELFISEKTADRYLRQYFGLSRKKISSIIRFQNSIRFLLNGGKETPAGYFDQSHFIHDFKRYSGITPEEFAGSVIK